MASPPASAGGRWPTLTDLRDTRQVAVTAVSTLDSAGAALAAGLLRAACDELRAFHSIGFKDIAPHAVREEGVDVGLTSQLASRAGHSAGVNRKVEVGFADELDGCMGRYWRERGGKEMTLG